MSNNRINLKYWKYDDADRVRLVYSDGDIVYVTREDFNRVFGPIVSADKHDVIRDFAIKDREGYT